MIQSQFCRHSNALPSGTCSFCNSAAPQKLLDLCFKYIIEHTDAVFENDCENGRLLLRKDVSLPLELCEKLWNVINEKVMNSESKDSFYVYIFKDTRNTRLKRVTLRKSNLNDDELKILLKHQLLEVNICDNSELTHESLDSLSEYGLYMQTLSFGKNLNIFKGALKDNLHYSQDYIFQAPSLKKLSINCIIDGRPDFFKVLLSNFPRLTHLDLSCCGELGDLNYIDHLDNLRSLVLYNVAKIELTIFSICKLKSLQHLDISQSLEENREFKEPTKLLTTIVESLPKLTSLDISGTNLAGTGVAEADCVFGSDIPGLISRVNNPFQYLGLYETSHDACQRHDIPAKLVAGNSNEEQILIATVAYMERPEILQKVLNELFHLFRFESCQYVGQALNIVLDAMNKHVNEKHIQITGGAILFYIVKSTGIELHDSVNVKRRLISTLLNGMSFFKDDATMMRNGCLTLCQFKIPVDVLFEYERLVNILLHTFHTMNAESFVQRIGIYLLNSLACQVDGQQKVRLGELGAIKLMIQLIKRRLDQNICDDVLEVAWSTMWNVTDETPANCQRFLEDKGMEYFLFCLKKFPDKEELLRNMMGLLGNVAEVQDLRHYLITPEYLGVFSDLLESRSDGIEVSYNAAGVISHIASDGPEVWNVTQPTRTEVLDKMVAAIDRWDLTSQRNINYRSFKPILHLVGVYHTPECQRWATWALANLTKVYPDKYCALVEKEGGLELLNQLIRHPYTPGAVRHLAETVIDNCRRHKEGDLDELLDG